MLSLSDPGDGCHYLRQDLAAVLVLGVGAQSSLQPQVRRPLSDDTGIVPLQLWANARVKKGLDPLLKMLCWNRGGCPCRFEMRNRAFGRRHAHVFPPTLAASAAIPPSALIGFVVRDATVPSRVPGPVLVVCELPCQFPRFILVACEPSSWHDGRVWRSHAVSPLHTKGRLSWDAWCEFPRWG